MDINAHVDAITREGKPTEQGGEIIGWAEWRPAARMRCCMCFCSRPACSSMIREKTSTTILLVLRVSSLVNSA
jgi:hypothetical protein